MTAEWRYGYIRISLLTEIKGHFYLLFIFSFPIILDVGVVCEGVTLHCDEKWNLLWWKIYLLWKFLCWECWDHFSSIMNTSSVFDFSEFCFDCIHVSWKFHKSSSSHQLIVVTNKYHVFSTSWFCSDKIRTTDDWAFYVNTLVWDSTTVQQQHLEKGERSAQIISLI